MNDRSVLDVLEDNQRKYNSYVDGISQDPEESWRWPGVRPITHNKVMSLAGHLTSAIIFPNVFAQNSADEEDRDSAMVMRDLVKWHILNTNYGVSFVFGIVAALVNPMTYFHIEYVEASQTIKTRDDKGNIVLNEVLDDVHSGIQVSTVPADEMFIADPYVFEIQKQKFLIRRRFINFDDAKQLFGDHKNFKFVQPGIRTIFNDDDNTFYDQKMDDIPTLIEWLTYYNRIEDTETDFINGIYVGDKDPEANPIKHRDNKNKPKYSFVPIRYEPYDEGRFFFSRSAVDNMIQDQDLVDMLWRLVIDATHISVNPPLGISGNNERITPGVMMPGAVTQFNEGTKIDALGQNTNLIAGINLIKETELSMSQSSQAPQQAGQQTQGGQTAFEVATLQQNARIQLGLAGKMIISSVKDLGDLLVDLIVKHQTVGQVEELVGGGTRLSFQKFLLPDEVENGVNVTKKIDFSEELIGMRFSESEFDDKVQAMQDDLVNANGGIASDVRIYKINPAVFSRLEFKIQIEADQLIPKNEQFEKALNLEAYDRMIVNPLADQVAVARDFLFETLKPGESDKYMSKNPQPIAPQQGGTSNAGTPLVQQMTKSQGMAGVLPQ